MSNYTPTFNGTVANSSSTFQRTFQSPSWVDGQDVVQAGDTPTETGFNTRLAQLQADLDAVKTDLVNAYALITQLRSDVATALVAVAVAVNSKTDKPAKEGKDTKETKDTKDAKEGKDGKETKEGKDGKEGKDAKEHKDGKETKESKEHKDGTEKGASFAEKIEGRDTPLQQVLGPAPFAISGEAAELAAPIGRAFIRPDERPPVGERLYDEPPA